MASAGTASEAEQAVVRFGKLDRVPDAKVYRLTPFGGELEDVEVWGATFQEFIDTGP